MLVQVPLSNGKETKLTKILVNTVKAASRFIIKLANDHYLQKWSPKIKYEVAVQYSVSVHNARNSPGDNNDSTLFSEAFLSSYCILPLLMTFPILKMLSHYCCTFGFIRA